MITKRHVPRLAPSVIRTSQCNFPCPNVFHDRLIFAGTKSDNCALLTPQVNDKGVQTGINGLAKAISR